MPLDQDQPIRIFFDESGYTGVDLHSTVQPLYALASTRLSDQEASSLLPRLRKGQAEFKYSRLKTRESGRKELIRIFSSGALSAENFRVCLTHKRFYLASQLVDKLIEPGYYEAGIDLYDRDGAVRLARLWHYNGAHIFPDGHWNNILAAFEVALRNRSAESFAAYDGVLQSAIERSDRSSHGLISWLRLSHGRLDEYLGVFDHHTAFDPAVDSFVALVSNWMKSTPGLIDAIHDDTKPLINQASLMAALRKLNLSARVIGNGERTMELPLRLANIVFSSSKEHPSLQLADLVAGAIIDLTLVLTGERDATDFHDSLSKTDLGGLVVNGVMPVPSFEAGPVRGPDEVSLVDGATKFLIDADYFRDSSSE